MKTLVRLTATILLALLATPRAAFAQAAPAQPAPADPAQPAPAQPAPPAGEPAAPPLAQPAASPAKPPDAGVAKGIEWTSLKLMRAKGLISEDEYSSALKDMGMPGAGTLMISKLNVTFFGFAQADFEWNSTQSCNDFCGNLQIQKPGTLRGDHSRVTFSPRDSRFGVRFAAAEDNGIKASGLLETDFFGPTTTTEQGTWANPVLRIRHAYLKLETPVIDILFGQTGNLFGWASAYLITGAQEPGLPGQMYQRTSQLKLSKTIKTDAGVTIELAVAAERPPQSDAGLPEGVAGFRLQFEKWTGYHTLYLSTSLAQPASIAVTGDLRAFKLAAFLPPANATNFLTGGGVAVDVFLPIIPASKTSHDGALSVSGEFVTGRGISDMYTGLGAAGTANAAIPPATMGGTPGVYTANFDPGLAAYDATGHAELIRWTSYMIGAEYYPPGVGGRIGLSANYGHMESSNAKNFETAPGRARKHENYYAGGVFCDPTKQTRIGVDFGFYDDHYSDDTVAQNSSVMMSSWLFF